MAIVNLFGRTSYRRFIRFCFEERCIGNSILLLLVNSPPLDFNNCSRGHYLTPNWALSALVTTACCCKRELMLYISDHTLFNYSILSFKRHFRRYGHKWVGHFLINQFCFIFNNIWPTIVKLRLVRVKMQTALFRKCCPVPR